MDIERHQNTPIDRERLYRSDNLPPAMIRARRRIEWAKTAALVLLFLGIMGAHVSYVWADAAQSPGLLLGPPLVLYNIAIVFILGARLKGRADYRRRLEAAAKRFPEHTKALESAGTAREAYASRLQGYSDRQLADIALVERARDESKTGVVKAGAITGGVAAVFALNLVLCFTVKWAFLGASLVFLGLGFAIALAGFAETIGEAIDDRIMLRHMKAERARLRDMRRDVAPEELTGALSAPLDEGSQAGALSSVVAEQGSISASD